MIRKLNVLILLVAVAGIVGLVIAMNQSVQTDGIRISGKVIEVFGKDYTLAKLAADVAKLAEEGGKFDAADVFTYNPETGEGFSKATMVIRGSLHIGNREDRRKGETLVLDTLVCGDLRLEVARGGELTLYHSDVKTGSEELTADQCSRGYALIVDGTLRAADTRFLYMSGTRSQTARESSIVDLERVTFALCDGCAFRVVEADGKGINIRDSKFSCEGQFGVIVEGSGGKPLVLRRCQLKGVMADLALRNGRTDVELIDCRFGPTKVKFFHKRGRVVVRWTVRAKVVAEGTDEPVAGATVVADGSGKGGSETVEATTGADGTCSLVLTQYVASPELPIPQLEVNGVTPHRMVVHSAAGKVLVELPAYTAQSPNAELTLTVPAKALAASR